MKSTALMVLKRPPHSFSSLVSIDERMMVRVRVVIYWIGYLVSWLFKSLELMAALGETAAQITIACINARGMVRVRLGSGC